MDDSDWFEAKRGKISASKASRLLGREDTLERLALELAGELQGDRNNFSGAGYADMGNEYEPMLANKYFMHHLDIELVEEKNCMLFHPEHFYATCSPDRRFKLESELEGLELKCKFDTEKNGDLSWRKVQEKPERSHLIQTQYSLWVSGYQRWVLYYGHISNDVLEGRGMIETKTYEILPDERMHAQFEERTALCWEKVLEHLK